MTGSPFNTESLGAFLQPRAVAIFGASENNARSFGSLALCNLIDNGYQGDLVVVHPSADAVFGISAVRSLADSSVKPDLAVIAIRAEAVPAAVEQCAAAGVRAVSVVGSGFAESGTDEGVALQRQVLSFVRSAGMRLLGPNTVGAAGFAGSAVSAASANIPRGIRPGDVAIVSQSGGLGTTILATAKRYGLGLGSFVALGNEADVSAADAIAHAVEQGASAVLCYLETLRDPAAFAAAAALARAQNVPVVMLKGGTGPRGQAIAVSHTAALAGSMRVMDSVLADIGVARVSSIESLVSAGALFGAFGTPPGVRVGALGIGGGNSALLADALEGADLELATLTQETSTQVKAMLPDSNGANPFDPGGWFLGRQPHLLDTALRYIADDPNIDVMIYGMVPMAPIREEVYVGAIAAVAKTSGKPAISLSMHTPVTEYREAAYADAGVLELPCTAATEALGVWLRHRVAAAASAEREEVAIIGAEHPGRARELDPALRQELATYGRVVLLEDRAIDVLSGFGLSFPATAIAESDDEARRLAGQIGYPLVVKAIAEGLHHRAQVGAVALGVTERTLDSDLARVRGNARNAVGPRAGVRLLLQRQAGAGNEMIVGIQRDPVFGPVILVGLGGVWSELLDDVSFGLPPITGIKAQRMLRRLRGWEYLERAHQSGDFDVDALIAVLRATGDIATVIGANLESLDLNPVIVNGAGATVVDALAILTTAR